MVRQITVQELAKLLEAKAPVYLLDVRTPGEHQLAALPGSLLVPLHELPGRKDEIQPPAGALLLAYCHHGVRSLHAAVFLAQCGFSDVVSLSGGIDAWSREIDPRVPRYA